MTPECGWLPKNPGWDDAFDALRKDVPGAGTWAALTALANHPIDFVQVGKLDRLAQRIYHTSLPEDLRPAPVRLALLGSSTVKHLIPGIRVAALRRKLWVEVYEGDYGQYLQELSDSSSKLYAFAPQFVCLALDAYHLLELSAAGLDAAVERLRRCWQFAQKAFRCTVVQQRFLPIFKDLLGNNEHRMADSPLTLVYRANSLIERYADEDGVQLLAMDRYAAFDGLRYWHDPALWHRSKQEIDPAAAPIYGEYLMRIVAAQRGCSRKCLVLDLDNTLWGGVIGDDGLKGIVLGQGNALGEAFLTFQRYILQLKNRGIILAVCSKNDEANALAPFETHPEMLLKRSDISCFRANWDDKAANLRQIAKLLNIGLDSLVFIDDNPFERNLVRQELPEVAVPELPQDPTLFVECLGSSGYFEGLTITDDDRVRASQYQANAERSLLLDSATDMASYLRDMRMELLWQPINEIDLQRVVQLINKTNQFNLTTQRCSEGEVRAAMADPKMLTWQVRLKDKFGDNGIIAVILGRLNSQHEFEIDSWLMSCRVLGRQVEAACLGLIVEGALRLGAHTLRGEYRPSAKNGMVRELYAKLGFSQASADAAGVTQWLLNLESFTPPKTPITILEVSYVTS